MLVSVKAFREKLDDYLEIAMTTDVRIKSEDWSKTWILTTPERRIFAGNRNLLRSLGLERLAAHISLTRMKQA